MRLSIIDASSVTGTAGRLYEQAPSLQFIPGLKS